MSRDEIIRQIALVLAEQRSYSGIGPGFLRNATSIYDRLVSIGLLAGDMGLPQPGIQVVSKGVWSEESRERKSQQMKEYWRARKSAAVK